MEDILIRFHGDYFNQMFNAAKGQAIAKKGRMIRMMEELNNVPPDDFERRFKIMLKYQNKNSNSY
ncbi:MAG: hypothetical protein PHX97_05750 [Dehalococcoidales bacterium]|nr:hypothetical protein [Dehalococcoidales bacterium]